ncbi:MICOS complex subunit MIC60 [Pseudocercospora fuligena]|uniref:MICOS complex subunit MIC60 n=1 Tax=Pseudocercospora fuligena TaxID=685502 RepID=A0A8H6RLF4_9PEZI|nr:MICOS complex subunit MIC60 [Pseudocercospora fuligena]
MQRPQPAGNEQQQPSRAENTHTETRYGVTTTRVWPNGAPIPRLDQQHTNQAALVASQAPPVVPQEEVDQESEVDYGISESDVRERACSRRWTRHKAPFGKGSETIVDDTVRKTWELNTNEFVVNNPYFNATVNHAVTKAMSEVGVTNLAQVGVSPYNMLLYEPGAMFKPHTDTEKVPGMFATLVICLPSPNEGGDIVLSHKGVAKRFATSTTQPSYACWYSDVTHEVKEVTSGYRLVLTYNIYKTSAIASNLSASLIGEQYPALKSALKNWRWVDSSEAIYILDHKYTDANLNINSLKGADVARVQALSHFAEKYKYEIFLASMEHMKSGEAAYEYDPYDRYGSRRGRYNDWYDDDDEDEDEDGSDGEFHAIEDIHDTETKLKRVIAPDGTQLIIDMTIEEECLLFEEAFQTYSRDPDDHDYTGYTGNAGAQSTHWYRDTVVVLVPRDKTIEWLMSAFSHKRDNSRQKKDIAPVINWLLRRLKNSSGETRNQIKSDLLETCYFILKENQSASSHTDYAGRPIDPKFPPHIISAVFCIFGKLKEYRSLANVVASSCMPLRSEAFKTLSPVINTHFAELQHALTEAFAKMPGVNATFEALKVLFDGDFNNRAGPAADWASGVLTKAVATMSNPSEQDGRALISIALSLKRSDFLENCINGPVSLCSNRTHFVLAFLAALIMDGEDVFEADEVLAAVRKCVTKRKKGKQAFDAWSARCQEAGEVLQRFDTAILKDMLGRRYGKIVEMRTLISDESNVPEIMKVAARMLPGSQSETTAGVPQAPVLATATSNPTPSPIDTPPKTPPTPAEVKATPPTPSTNTGNLPPVGTGTAATGPTSAPPPPPKKKGRFRRFLLSLVILSALGYAGGVYYSLVNDNFHDFFTEYVSFGEDAVSYFEEREFRKRFPGRSTDSGRNWPQTRGENKVTVASHSGVVPRVAAKDNNGEDLGQKGRHTTATDDNKPKPKAAEQKQEPTKPEAPDVSHKLLPKKEISTVDHINAPEAQEPAVQELIKLVNGIITSINGSPESSKYEGTVAEAKNNLNKVIAEIKIVRDKAAHDADTQVKNAHLEFDQAAKELVRRLEGEMREQETRWREEYEQEREKLSNSYQQKLSAELDAARKVFDQKNKNSLIEQEIALQKRFMDDVKAKIEEERNGRLSKLDELSTSVNELEKLTTQWNEVVDATLQTQHLQVALEAVRSKLQESDVPTPFINELVALKEVSKNNDVVNAAIASINPAAYQRGVPSAAALIDRFRRVASEVRKASLLPEDAGVASHAASAVLSRLMFQKKSDRGLPEGDDVEATLARTEVLLEEGDLDAAAREMNGLRGWAGVLSRDWVAECRRVLEVRQAVDVISAEARLQSLLVE